MFDKEELQTLYNIIHIALLHPTEGGLKISGPATVLAQKIAELAKPSEKVVDEKVE